MKKNCLGFPIWKGRVGHRVAKFWYRGVRICGLVNFKLSDYNKYNYKVGDIVHDCDGFNHRLAKIVPDYDRVKKPARGKILFDLQFYKEDGTAFCHVTPALPAEHIRKHYEELKTSERNKTWGFTARYEQIYGKNFSIADDGTIIRGDAITTVVDTDTKTE